MKVQNTNFNMKAYIAALLSLSFFNGGEVKSDSTFFPEDKTAEKPKLEGSEEIKEWAELKPTSKEPKKLIPQAQPETTEASFTQTEATSTPPATDAQEQKPAETLATLPESNTTITETTETLSAVEAPKPTETLATSTESDTSVTKASEAPAIAEAPKTAETLAPLPKSNTILTEAPATSSTIEEKKPLEVTKVTARPKPAPVKEEPQAAANGKGQGALPSKVVSYSDAANDRPPLGILSPKQEVHNQRWYIYSSAIRGLKNPSDVVQIVSMAGAPAQKGEDIKNLLIEMGIEADKIQLINARGEEDQAGVVYIFAGK